MNSIGILGAGEASATLARRIAESELARCVILVDRDEGKARGKALDIAQSGPVEGYDTQVIGTAQASGPFDVVVIGESATPEPVGTKDLLTLALPLLGEQGVLLAMLGEPWAVLEMSESFGVPRERALGSVPLALAAAVRQHLALELGAGPREVSALVMGRPPRLFVPRESATLAGMPVDALSPVALRRALAAAVARRRGPMALAAAALGILHALAGGRPRVLPVAARLSGEYGHRGPVLAVPARLGGGRLLEVVELPLGTADRVTLDNAAERRGA